MNYTVIPCKMSGEVVLPPSKSISHRAIICASLSNGESKISNVLFSDDIYRTLDVVKSFGAKVEIRGTDLIVKGVKDINFNNLLLNCNESGSTLRFFIPIALLTNQTIIFDGLNKLPDRPLDTYFKLFEENNIEYRRHSERNLPLSVIGKLNETHLKVEGHVSSQYITGLLFALAYTKKEASITLTTPLQSKRYVDITIDVLNKFGINVENIDYKLLKIRAGQSFIPQTFNVEGDLSSLAFWAQTGAMHGNITCKNFNSNSIQGDIELIKFLKKMNIEYKLYGNSISFYKSKITGGAEIDLIDTPDLAPSLMALSAIAKGKTTFLNTDRLKIKESSRAEAMQEGLNKMGADVRLLENKIIVNGVNGKLQGGCFVSGYKDHRIVMALTLAATSCLSPVTISNTNYVNKSYPNFWVDFEKLKGK